MSPHSQLLQRPSRPGIALFGRVLEESERLLQAGRHNASLAMLARVGKGDIRLDADDFRIWSGVAIVMAARNRFHLGDEGGAIICLKDVSIEARRSNPELDSTWLCLMALIARRVAHRQWKAGNLPAALAALEDARTALVGSREASLLCANEQVAKILAGNADQNEIYTEGLAAAIAGKSLERNPFLLIRMLDVERRIRAWTAPAARDDAPGITMLCDLAVGARMSLRDLFDTAPNGEHRAMFSEILGNNQSWVELLLSLSRREGRNPTTTARALVLGARLLSDSEESPDREQLVQAYQVRLSDCLFALQAETQTETEGTRRIRRTLFELAALTPRPFTGRRMFR